MSIEQARARYAALNYARYLDAMPVEVERGRAVLHLPFDPAHTNPGGALNGGVTVSLMNLAGTLAAWTDIDLAVEPFLGSVDLTVQYVAAAVEEEVWGSARVIRRGRDLFFLDTAVYNREKTPICQGLMIYRAPHYGDTSRRTFAQPLLFADVPVTEGSAPGVHFGPFFDKLQLAAMHRQPGRVRLRMPCLPELLDERGQLHEGTLAALLDVAGTAASWTLARSRGSRGATIGMQLSFVNAVREDVIADAIVQQRSEELFFSNVQITTMATRQLVAMGNVSYRILEARQ